jgi:hypothetical protein
MSVWPAIKRAKQPECFFMKNDTQPDSQLLLDLVKMKMPFGKYKGTVLCYLPVSYLEWFNAKGFPEGKLGMLLRTIYEIKLNGLEYLLDPIKKMNQSS